MIRLKGILKMRNNSLCLLIAAIFVTTGCAEVVDAPIDDVQSGKPETAASEGGKEDRWDGINNPSRFDSADEFNYVLAELPLNGRSEEEAWPSTYYPTYEDSIQHRWQGRTHLSPAELYDKAFNGWVASEGFEDLRPFEPGNCDEDHWDRNYYDELGPLANHVSRNMGNRDARDGVDSDGDGDVDECGDHDGVQTWFGLCHAWVPASIHEPRPLGPVTYEGVTFEVGDMEGLLMLAYNRSSAAMIGGRCNLFSTDEEMATVRRCRLPDTQPEEGDTMRECSEWELNSYVVERDEHGAVVQNQCDDTNPGSFHVAMTNLLGLEHRAFAYDQTWNYEVWNQPVVAYDISKLEEITAAQANELLNLTGDTYEINTDAAQLFEVRGTSTYITEAYASTTPAAASRYERNNHHNYILEVDADGKIIGGEWFGDSVEDHPDFLWDPARRETSSVEPLDLENVRMLVQLSRGAPVPGDGDVIEVSGQGGIAIPDNTPAGVSSTANVTETATIGGVQIELDITHTYKGDLRVTLSHNGTDRIVHDRVGGSEDNINETFTVPGFNGEEASGQWTLKVQDLAGQDIGTLNSWKLLITPGTAGGGDTGGDTGGGANTTSVAIPDNNPAGAASAVNVTDSITLGSVEAHVVIRHTYIGDLKVTLSHGGVTHVLHNNQGGGADDIDKVYTLDAFDGQNSAGEWVLKVVDSANLDTGSIESVTLSFTGSSDGGTDTGGDDGPQIYPGAGGISIPDNTPAGINSEAGVPANTTGSMSARVNITHTWRGDLKVTLTHGDDSWVLHNLAGSSADNLNQTYVLDPAPTGDLGGTWTLNVSDNAGQDLGTLDSWDLVVQ